MPVALGLANCSYCGAKVGTVFDETAGPSTIASLNRWAKVPGMMDEDQRIEKAQDRANNSVIFGLSSFFPLLGLALGITAVLYGTLATRTLKAHNIEDGRGAAAAGFVIGSLGLIAQACIILYAMKLISGVKS
jgi:hypothetical protein